MADIQVLGPPVERAEEILTPQALAFVADLNRRFRPIRDRLLARRAERRAEIGRTGRLDFPAETASLRAAAWKVAPAPADLVDRRVEITGPTERKMTINALNSGARVWLADLEDANTPHWENVVSGQVNLVDAVRRKISYTAPGGKEYRLRGDRVPLPAIVVRPRGWHLDEPHVLVDGQPAVGALVDFGLYFFHNAHELLRRDSGPYFYLPKMENHYEARLWNQVFAHAQESLGIAHGTIRATVLIETITAAFEMEEILYELREHASGLNAGRWDYLFSVIKNFRDAGEEFVLPDRASVGMTAPFMSAYAELLVATCHRRGAHAIGGMAAFIPNRRDSEVTSRALAKVREDKQREAALGYDGSWVAHPDLVPVCREVFDPVLGEEPNQLAKRPRLRADAARLLDVAATPGQITEAGVRTNLSVGVRYVASWLRGTGAAAIDNLMEDAATAEISRSQLWQWLRYSVRLADGRRVTPDLIHSLLAELRASLRTELGDQAYVAQRYAEAEELFARLVLDADFADFLTIPAQALIP
ncbi:malate synthase A [Allokutzneria albata]|uniref:Malate synthase n=1 Tax=Allokutzneria albata TaxID=211114 RepID=A0A1H0CHQ3_ALLAB|nr:malate synthase A [Allokutzneria albata]SDN57301.1 malate synthase [Allokutzneria albata]